jgi:hypothetical protein
VVGASPVPVHGVALPDVDMLPIVDVVPIVEVLPNVVIGTKVVVGTVNMGLTPPAPSSVAPIVIPVRPTAVGDEADAAAPAKELPAVVGQMPDAVPAMPPPSNTVVDTEVPAVEVPMPDDIPVIEPVIELPVPDDVPMVELPMVLTDDCAIEPPEPLHAGRVPVVATVDVTGGLMPGDPSCVAPRGMLVGGTGDPGPMPSGDVMPSGEGPGAIPPTCAKAEPQLNRTAAVVVTTKRVIVCSSLR